MTEALLRTRRSSTPHVALLRSDFYQFPCSPAKDDDRHNGDG